MTAALGRKLEPETVTVEPGNPDVGVMVMAGTVAVNGVDAVVAPARAETVWAPDAADGTVNEAVKAPVPLVVTVAGLVTWLAPSNATLTKVLAAKFVPVTVRDVPAGPEVGEAVTEDSGLTVKGAESVAVPPVADTVWLPAVDPDGTANVAVKPPEELAVTVAGVVVIRTLS